MHIMLTSETPLRYSQVRNKITSTRNLVLITQFMKLLSHKIIIKFYILCILILIYLLSYISLWERQKGPLMEVYVSIRLISLSGGGKSKEYLKKIHFFCHLLHNHLKIRRELLRSFSFCSHSFEVPTTLIH